MARPKKEPTLTIIVKLNNCSPNVIMETANKLILAANSTLQGEGSIAAAFMTGLPDKVNLV